MNKTTFSLLTYCVGGSKLLRAVLFILLTVIISSCSNEKISNELALKEKEDLIDARIDSLQNYAKSLNTESTMTLEEIDEIMSFAPGAWDIYEKEYSTQWRKYEEIHDKLWDEYSKKSEEVYLPFHETEKNEMIKLSNSDFVAYSLLLVAEKDQKVEEFRKSYFSKPLTEYFVITYAKFDECYEKERLLMETYFKKDKKVYDAFEAEDQKLKKKYHDEFIKHKRNNMKLHI